MDLGNLNGVFESSAPENRPTPTVSGGTSLAAVPKANADAFVHAIIFYSGGVFQVDREPPLPGDDQISLLACPLAQLYFGCSRNVVMCSVKLAGAGIKLVPFSVAESNHQSFLDWRAAIAEGSALMRTATERHTRHLAHAREEY